MSRLLSKFASLMVSVVILVSISFTTFKVQRVEASGTIHIRANGLVEGTGKITSTDNITYTFTDNIYDEIVVERNNVIIDGNGYTLQGTGVSSSKGVDVSGRSNVVIRNLEISAFECGISLNYSQNTRIIENNITSGTINSRGICFVSSSNNAISRNNITNNFVGIQIQSSNNNNIFENNITNNGYGLSLGESSYNTIVGNNIVRNTHWAGGYGVKLLWSPDNTFFHNNFIDNDKQIAETSYVSVWDDGYPSGGNYWSDFEERYPDVKDVCSGPYQNDTGSDGIWDHAYWIDFYPNRDNYPFVNLCVPSIYHELVVSTTAPASISLGSSSSLDATVTNQGSVDEPNVEFLLLINGTTVGSTTIPLLKVDSSYSLSYSWTPTATRAQAQYNITAYAHPVSGEKWVKNNQQSKLASVWAVGIKAGDWIRYAYSYEGSYATLYTAWTEVEFLSVEGTTVTICGTMHLSDGTEQNETFTVNMADLYPWMYAPVFDTLSGFVMLANTTVGDTAWIGNTTGKPCASITHYTGEAWGSSIKGETERTYVGTSRTVVYAEYSFIKYGPLTCYWDKQTGVLVEASKTGSDGWTAKVVETNMWEAVPEEEEVPFWMQWWFYAIVAVVIVALAGTVYFLKKRRSLGSP